jgi:phosphomannomutase / phosphoglucomutase
MTAVPAEIFRAYDIRGVVGATLTPPIVRAVGQALGTLALEAGDTTIAIGRDGRLSGLSLSAALAEGIAASGANVFDVGMVPTPVAYFAAHHLECGSAVMLTGSHNPPDYNGLKMVIAGHTLSGDTVQDLRKRIEAGKVSTGAGSIEAREVSEAYLERILGDVKLARPMRMPRNSFGVWAAKSPGSSARSTEPSRTTIPILRSRKTSSISSPH